MLKELHAGPLSRLVMILEGLPSFIALGLVALNVHALQNQVEKTLHYQ